MVLSHTVYNDYIGSLENEIAPKLFITNFPLFHRFEWLNSYNCWASPALAIEPADFNKVK